MTRQLILSADVPVRISASRLWDNTSLLTVLVSRPYGLRAQVFHEVGGNVFKLLESDDLGKDDSASAFALEDGTVVLFVSEADPGGSGTTSKVWKYMTGPNAVTPRLVTDVWTQSNVQYVYNFFRFIQSKFVALGQEIAGW